MRIILLLATMVLIVLQRDVDGTPLVNQYHGLIVVLAVLALAVISEAVSITR